MITAHLAPDPTAALWQAAHHWLAGVLRAFGHPARIARLAHSACAALKRELKALEALVLKLLLIEASRFEAKPQPRNASCRAARATRVALNAGAIAAGRGSGEDPADPETWRVRFRLRLPQVQTRRRRRADAQRPRPARAPQPLDLARRCEALRRVLADPTPAVVRLARKLRTLGARAGAAARRIAMLRPRDLPCAPMLYAHACVCAHDSAHRFRGSG